MSIVAAAPACPFKGLAAFEDSDLDALFFFGRERETEVIVANLLAAKLTVLYGPSGVGKSSVLRAGVARRLRQIATDAEVEILDVWSGSAEIPKPAGEAFLTLDQLEEYFVYHDEAPLLEELMAALAQPRVHVLLALREDALARLDAFQARIPNVLANRLRLDHLDEAAARAAIVGPLDAWNTAVDRDDYVGIETELVDAVLEQVATTPEADGSLATGLIEAPYLQLVMERLWSEERSNHSRVLRAETLSALGGARVIVSAHLERALGGLPPREAEIATKALKFLVTPSRTKIAHSIGDLVGFTNESPVELRRVLELLALQRILRSAEGESDGRRYEIFHDVLAEPVLAWRREFEGKAALAEATRRHRRLMRIAAGAALLAAAMVALAVYAFAQRGEAAKQRRVAQEKAQLAQSQAAQRLVQERRARREAHLAEVQRRRAEHQKAIAQQQELIAKNQKQIADEQQRIAERQTRAAQHEQHVADTKTAVAQHAQHVADKERRVADRQRKLALARRRDALRAEAHAKLQARRAHVGELVATALADLGIDPVKSVRAALAASALEQSNRIEDALRAALVALRVRAILPGGGGAIRAAVFSPDGSLVATAAEGGAVRIFSTRTHVVLHNLEVGSPIESLAFSRDGRLLVAGAHDGRALLWDAETGALVNTLRNGAAVLAVGFGGGGGLIVTGSADKAIRIWDAQGNLLHAIVGRGAIEQLALSPDGSLAVAISPGDPVARVYDLASGQRVASLAHPADVSAAAFSPSGNLLVIGANRDGYAWDTRDWSLKYRLVGHTATISDVVFAPDGRIVTASVDSSARVWDPSTGALIFALASQHEQTLFAAAVSPDGQQIATASGDQTARIWGSPLGSVPSVLAGHTDAVTGVSFSPDGRLVLTASADGTARLWDPSVPQLAPIGTQPGAITAVTYSPDGRLVLSAGADGTARIWRPGGGPVQTLRHAGSVIAATFVSRGAEVLTASEDGTAKLWRVADGSLLATYPHGAPVRAALAVPGSGVVTVGDDGAVRMWTSGGKLLWSDSQGSPIKAAAVSGDGVVATGAANGSIDLWRVRDGRPLAILAGHTKAITSLAFSADGSLLASGSNDATARIWNVRTRSLVHALFGHSLAVTSVAFSPDRRLVLTASVDGDARLWSVATGKTVHRLHFHVATVSQAAFSPDGRWAVTAGPSTAGIWQVRTGSLLYFVGNSGGVLSSAAFAPDSRRIAVGSKAGVVSVFNCKVCVRTSGLRGQARSELAALRPRGR